MHTLQHQKQKQKTRRLPGTKIYKGCLGLINENYLNKNKSKNYIGLNIDKKKIKNISTV